MIILLMATRNEGEASQLRLVVYPIIYRVFYIHCTILKEIPQNDHSFASLIPTKCEIQ